LKTDATKKKNLVRLLDSLNKVEKENTDATEFTIPERV
jgi:hypothetical protein